MDNVWTAFGLTLLAGMATGVGSVIAFFAARTNYRLLSVCTGFSAGVMLYVSFVELLQDATTALARAYGDRAGGWVSAASFFGGILLIGLIDNLVPARENPHEAHPDEETRRLRWAGAAGARERRLLRTGLLTALAIGIHNFPEGVATFLAALGDPHVGVAIAIAVALHNIPEGISVSVPIFFATGSRRRALIYSLLSGMAEPVAAVAAYVALWLVMGAGANAVPPQVMGILLGGVAGIMVYISLDELLPTSRAYGRGHDSVLGLAAGMAVMAVTLLLMR